MPLRACAVTTLLLVALTAAEPRVASAQTGKTWSADFMRIATDLVGSIADPHPVKIVVLPVVDDGGLFDPRLSAAMTEGLRRALLAVRRPDGRSLQIVDDTEWRAALQRMQLPLPRSQPAAALTANLVSADYAVFGTVGIGTGDGDATLRASLVDARTNDVSWTSTAPVLAAAANAPNRATPVTVGGLERPFWTPRRLVAAAGFAATGFAAAMAIRSENQVRDAKQALLDVPSGAIDQFNSQLSAATRLEKTRNFWWGAAGGIGGLTIIYLLIHPSPDVGPFTRPGPPRPEWRLQVNSAGPGMAIAYAF
jgi:hypothetical protein